MTTRPKTPPTAAPAQASEQQAERVRTRVRLLVELTTRAGRYRRGLVQAASRLTPHEAVVLSDLEAHGLDVDQLRDVLCGGHVLVDDPTLYERWSFPDVSRPRLSSHHRHIDKRQYPDLGMRGPLVREKLHGRTAGGTWVQLEKTPASFGGSRRLPTWSDVEHLVDYVVYRLTRRNVGPWGLSGVTERRPMYLSPDLTALVPLPTATAVVLAGTLHRIESEDDEPAATSDPGMTRPLAASFPPPRRADAVAELVPDPERGRGRGLFGSSSVWVTESAATTARRLLTQPAPRLEWATPRVDTTRPVEVAVGGRRLVMGARTGRDGLGSATTSAARKGSSS